MIEDRYEKRLIGLLPAEAAARWGGREALVFGSQRFSFAEFSEEVDYVSRGLLGLGVVPGEKISLWFPDRPRWLFAFFAAVKIGAVVLPLNTRLRAHDLAYAIEASDTTTLILADRAGPVDFVHSVLELLPNLASFSLEDRPSQNFPQLRRVILDGNHGIRGATSWEEMIAAGRSISETTLESRSRDVKYEDPALIMFTSGSTGNPKGVVHSHNLTRNVIDQCDRLSVDVRDTILMYLPLFHAFGLYEGALTVPLTGARMVLQEHFDPDEALRLVERERCTITHGFDTHFNDLLHSPELEKCDTSSLRTGILAAGMASSEPVARQTQRRLVPTVSAWGMTEVGVGGTLGCLDDDEEARCLGSGRPLSGYEIRIVDPDTGVEVSQGSVGELHVKSYMLLIEYYKAPQATANALSEDGWFKTGDQASLNADGSIRFLGRYKEMLKVGGENVDPFEVEAYLLRHPAIDHIQVIGCPHERLTEVPVACVIARGQTSPDSDDIIGFCRGQLASFKIPRRVFLMKEFPMTSSGKVQRFKLRERIIGWIEQESVDL